MQNQRHDLANLFAQLGLAHDPAAIDAFIAAHRPLPAGVRLADAPFWSPTQAAFLAEELQVDADWAEVIDELNSELGRAH
ncbi:MAG: DUF2789 domain-containing protein [Rhodocyclales bacterium]|nr:DUF2789 domain-containing protein [Rhodocyclales bacterium]